MAKLLVDLHAARRGRHHSDAAPAVTQKPMSPPEIAGTGRIRLHVIVTSIPGKIVHQAPCHVDVGYFILVAAGYPHLPATDAFAEKQRRRKLRAFLDTHAACCAVTRAG